MSGYRAGERAGQERVQGMRGHRTCGAQGIRGPVHERGQGMSGLKAGVGEGQEGAQGMSGRMA